MVPFPEGEVVGVVEGDPTGKVTRVRCLPPLAGQVVVIPLPRLRDCRRVPPPL